MGFLLHPSAGLPPALSSRDVSRDPLQDGRARLIDREVRWNDDIGCPNHRINLGFVGVSIRGCDVV